MQGDRFFCCGASECNRAGLSEIEFLQLSRSEVFSVVCEGAEIERFAGLGAGRSSGKVGSDVAILGKLDEIEKRPKHIYRGLREAIVEEIRQVI
jgi:hypothetical protein